MGGLAAGHAEWLAVVFERGLRWQCDCQQAVVEKVKVDGAAAQLAAVSLESVDQGGIHGPLRTYVATIVDVARKLGHDVAPLR
jgi:hypothetical protein